MGVKFKPFAASGNQSADTTFTDEFTRVNATTLGPSYIIMPLQTSVGAGVISVCQPSITANRAQFAGQGPINPVQSVPMLWTPRTVANNIYNAGRVFVEVEFVSTAGGFTGGLCVRANFENLGAITTPPFADYYVLQFDGGIFRVLGGGAYTVFGGTAWTPNAGDILRFEAENSGNTVILRQIRNGVTIDTEVQDGASIDISQMGYNGIVYQGCAGTPANDSFIINRLTVGSF